MAITESFPRLKVSISVGKVAVEEHADDDAEEQPNSVTKYIEAASGTEFAVDYEFTKPWPANSIMLQFSVDGKGVGGTLVLQSAFTGTVYKRSNEGVFSGEGSNWFIEKFCFADLVIDDSGTHPTEEKLMKELKEMGEIVVKVYNIKNTRPSDQGLRKINLKRTDVVPEKALKGRSLSHQSNLRPPVSTAASSVYDYDHMDPAKKPFAVFTFKYRSRAALQSLLVIPRSPRPVPLEDRDVDTLSPEEMRELLRRQRERDSVARAVKREGGVKREHSHTVIAEDDEDVSFVSAKRTRFPVTLDEDGVETIDLT